jgi:hypothetical protein
VEQGELFILMGGVSCSVSKDHLCIHRTFLKWHSIINPAVMQKCIFIQLQYYVYVCSELVKLSLK